MTTCTDELRRPRGARAESGSSRAAATPVSRDSTPPVTSTIGTLHHIIPAPLELTVDNFNEIEHSGTVHDTFGYDLDRMHEVKVAVRSRPTTAYRVINVGPTKPFNRLRCLLLGVRRGDTFHDDWTTLLLAGLLRVRSLVDEPGRPRERWSAGGSTSSSSRIDDGRRAVRGHATRSRAARPGGGLRGWSAGSLRREIDRELRADVAMLDHTGRYDTASTG